jgi:group II intron reverse transcriptase/maturase
MEGTMAGTANPDDISTRLQRIATLAKKSPDMVLYSLHHHIDLAWLQKAYQRTRKSGAAGVDGQTAQEYAKHLDENLTSLLNRFKSGKYRAPPVRRVHIPKGDGKTRPLGIPTFEDKVLQRAVAMLMEAVYEQDFLDCSYGFRPGRSAHKALAHLKETLESMGGGWVYEVDIQAFYDTLVPIHLRGFLDQRITDGVVRRTIDKWLKAGVLEDGKLTQPDLGTPQGGVISPLLSNIYLHEVLDKWFASDVQPRLRGDAKLIRYADDLVIVFSEWHDAQRVAEVLPQRFAKFGLTVHPEKTKLVPFHPTLRATSQWLGKHAVEKDSFDLLGFTHLWRPFRGWGPKLMRITMSTRFTRGLARITEWCRLNRSKRRAVQHAKISKKLVGHYGYYGLEGNSRSLKNFRYEVCRTWFKWLNRRSQRRSLTWERFNRYLERHPLPTAKISHKAIPSSKPVSPRSRMR